MIEKNNDNFLSKVVNFLVSEVCLQHEACSLVLQCQVTWLHQLAIHVKSCIAPSAIPQSNGDRVHCYHFKLLIAIARNCKPQSLLLMLDHQAAISELDTAEGGRQGVTRLVVVIGDEKHGVTIYVE